MRLKKIEKRQWINFSIWATLYILFSIWMVNGWLLFGLIVLVDIFLTKFIPWGAWKKSDNPKIQNILNWVDDILFALIAVYIINLFVFQNYQIPTSSLEKTLMVGDFLFVSKLSYGPRVPNTPVSFPLVQNTIPILNCKSYLEWPNWEYKRVKGLGQVKRNDIVVFNFPTGDTVTLKVQNPDFYTLVHQVGRETVLRNKSTYGEIIYRPVDKRENYVKRCIGMPGDSLQIIDNQVYIDGELLKDMKNVQYAYYVETDGMLIKDEMFRRMKVSKEDQILITSNTSPSNYYKQLFSYMGFQSDADGRYNPIYRLPLTAEAYEIVKKMTSVRNIVIEPEIVSEDLFPIGYPTGWTRDNYGPIWIPKKGATIRLDRKNLALYHRCIQNHENNTLEVKENGSILINGQPADSYTFRYDYYWMMGDNRHNSADSRSWGFVPEDHVVGKPILVWLSIDKDHSLFDGGIRWDRMFRKVESFN